MSRSCPDCGAAVVQENAQLLTKWHGMIARERFINLNRSEISQMLPNKSYLISRLKYII
jgi:hypothetical protein